MKTIVTPNLVAGIAFTTLVLTAAGCTVYRGPITEFVSEPVQFARPLPLTVRNEAWSAIMKTLVLEGEVIESAQKSLHRVTFRKALNATDLPKLCDTSTAKDFDASTWQFNSGNIEMEVWLDDEPKDEKEIQLKMEGRCQATYEPPRSRKLLVTGGGTPLAGIFLWPAHILTLGKATEWAFDPRSFELASTGKLERELQEKIITTLGINLPPWLHRRDQ